MKYTPTGKERFFHEEDIIVSKTDLRGHIRYANDVFLNVSGYTEDEVIGQPHNIIRHPDMPASIFQLLWETLHDQKEIFAYVDNLAKGGDHYWVFAHVTPSYDLKGNHTGYHSNRRVPHPDALEKIKDLYALLKTEEQKHGSIKQGMAAARSLLDQTLSSLNMTYGEYVFSLSKHTQLETCER